MVLGLVRDAYDRRTISWARRNEMLDRLDTLMDLGTYALPSADRSIVALGVFAEPSQVFLIEIDMVPNISGMLRGRP